MASKRNKRYQPPNSPGRIVSGRRGRALLILWTHHPDFSNIESSYNKAKRRVEASYIQGVSGTAPMDTGAVSMRRKIRSLQPSTGEAA